MIASDIDIHQKKYSIVKNIGYRAWFYFRMGWSTYFAFILAAINTLTVTYFLAIENYSELMAVFPSFEIYIVIITSVGIPTLIFVGYSHYKKTNVFKSEVDILVESNPILRRTTVNADMNYMNEKMRKKSDYVLPKNPGLV